MIKDRRLRIKGHQVDESVLVVLRLTLEEERFVRKYLCDLSK